MHPVEAELRELAHQLAGQDPLLEPVADIGKHALAHELSNGVADRLLLFAQQRLEGEEVERIERGRLGLRHGHERSVVPAFRLDRGLCIVLHC